jgi:outer membrane receptor protein involved in Fe transport
VNTYDYGKGKYQIEMRLAPVVQVAAGLDLPFELPKDLGRVIPTVAYRYRTEQRVELTVDPNGLPNGVGMSDPAGYLDASVSVDFDNFLSMSWRLTGYVKNITDYVELISYSNVGIAERVLYGRPRTWGIELSARYN